VAGVRLVHRQLCRERIEDWHTPFARGAFGVLLALDRVPTAGDVDHTREDAPGTKDEETHAGWAPVLARIDSARKALDTIGWDTPDEQQPATLALTTAMHEALHADLDTWRWTAQAEHLESAEGRAQAASKAERIERFLATTPK
jgi:hypothetical protein